MTVQDLIQTGVFEVVVAGRDADTIIQQPFCCDLLSIAMSKAPGACAWITVMGNINTLAVASLVEAACVVLAEDSMLDEAGLIKAKEQQITVLKTSLPIFEAALKIHMFLQDEAGV